MHLYASIIIIIVMRIWNFLGKEVFLMGSF